MSLAKQNKRPTDKMKGLSGPERPRVYSWYKTRRIGKGREVEWSLEP